MDESLVLLTDDFELPPSMTCRRVRAAGRVIAVPFTPFPSAMVVDEEAMGPAVGVCVFSSTPTTEDDAFLKPARTFAVLDSGSGEPGDTNEGDEGLNILVARGNPIADALLGPAGVEVAVVGIADGGGDRGGEAGDS